MRGFRILLPVLIAALVSVSAASAERSAVPASGAEPDAVASLDPARTAELWNRLVSRPRSARAAQATECRPLRAVFYAATDWLRLATKLAEQASPCAEYYISVPAIVGNRTRMRPNAAWRIRALGPNFHAMSEVHFTAWNRWVQETGSSWHAAGVTARQRMVEAGFDVALGDTWQLNELSTAVRRGEGNARANIREFLRGLYEGDGSRPTRGAALVVGVGQRTGDLSVYQNTLQSWLADTSFWTEVQTYVSDWVQEVYGDVRSHAVPGTPTAMRREYLTDYLLHKHVLSGVAPSESTEPARSYLREAHTTLGNAAWERDTGYGWTMVSAEQMAAYVSAQVDALRRYTVTAGLPRDHWGFAWAPRNANGTSAEDFAARTDLVLERMAAAIRDSGNVIDPESPGSGACGPPGQDTFCLVDLADARHNEGWRSFRAWTQATLAIGNAAQTVSAGTPSAAMTISLVTGTGLGLTSGGPRAVTLRSSSPAGTFSTSPEGPWTSTLALTIAPRQSIAFHYLDTRAGRHRLTATSEGLTAGAQTVTVIADSPATLALSPTSGETRAWGTRRLVVKAEDAYGNAASGAAVTWSVSPAALGTVEPGDDGTATFTAGRLLRTGTVTASSGFVSASASVTVVAGRLRIAPFVFRPGKRGLRVTLATTDGTRRPVSAARVRIVVKLGGRRHFVGQVRTGAAGKALVRVPGGRGCFTVTVTRATAQGFAWDGRTPRNRFCRR